MEWRKPGPAFGLCYRRSIMRKMMLRPDGQNLARTIPRRKAEAFRSRNWSSLQTLSHGYAVTARHRSGSGEGNVGRTWGPAKHRPVNLTLPSIRLLSSKASGLSSHASNCVTCVSGTDCNQRPRNGPCEGWWAMHDSNMRPLRCEHSALPTELIALTSDRGSYRVVSPAGSRVKTVAARVPAAP